MCRQSIVLYGLFVVINQSVAERTSLELLIEKKLTESNPKRCLEIWSRVHWLS